jgi:hypothetical protein
MSDGHTKSNMPDPPLTIEAGVGTPLIDFRFVDGIGHIRGRCTGMTLPGTFGIAVRMARQIQRRAQGRSLKLQVDLNEIPTAIEAPIKAILDVLKQALEAPTDALDIKVLWIVPRNRPSIKRFVDKMVDLYGDLILPIE